MRKILCLSVFALMILMCRTDVQAATENDMREVMGLERIEGSEWEKTAAKILSQCRSQKNYNNFVDEIGSVKNEESEVLAKQIKKKTEYYNVFRESFLAGAPAWELTDTLTDYDRLYQVVNSYADAPQIAEELEKYDWKTIAEQEAYAKNIQKLCGSSGNIGDVGQKADTFLKANLRIAGLTEDSVTCHATPKDRVYAQFSGKVTTVDSDSVTVLSGKTTEFTISGIQPVKGLKAGKKVKQYDVIGKAKTETVTASMKTGTDRENPLKIYGTRAAYWLDEYLQTEPWAEDDAVDLSKVKDQTDQKEEETTAVSTMTDENGKESELTVKNNPYSKDDETVLPKEIINYLGQQADGGEKDAEDQ